MVVLYIPGSNLSSIACHVILLIFVLGSFYTCIPNYFLIIHSRLPGEALFLASGSVMTQRTETELDRDGEGERARSSMNEVRAGGQRRNRVRRTADKHQPATSIFKGPLYIAVCLNCCKDTQHI